MTINERIAELRHTLKLTQPVFAGRICISKGYIASIELGNKKVNDRIVRLIASSFNVNEDWIKTGEGSMFKDSDSYQDEEVINFFKKLSPFFQDYFLNQLKQIYEYEQNGKRLGTSTQKK
jgi:transcriptional regulator with XRE-family HTH domain